MMLFMLILWVVLAGVLVLIASVRPSLPTLGEFELHRRAATGDRHAQATLRRVGLSGDVLSLQRSLTALLLVVLTLFAVAAFGWLSGGLLAVLLAIFYGPVARQAAVRHQSQKLYGRYEDQLLAFVERFPKVFRAIRSDTPRPLRPSRLDSPEELEELIRHAGEVLTSDERKLLLGALRFDARTVKGIMTPRVEIASISKSELLGPLVLDDLHKTGHSRFPVIDADLDHIIGVLSVQQLLSLDTKRSVTAEKAMLPRVFYVREDQSLRAALAAFLMTKGQLLVVVDEMQKTVGLLTLGDVVTALLGRKLTDEFDRHDNLPAVAARPKDD